MVPTTSRWSHTNCYLGIGMIQSLLSQACNFLIDFIKKFKVKWGEGQETLIKKKKIAMMQQSPVTFPNSDFRIKLPRNRLTYVNKLIS